MQEGKACPQSRRLLAPAQAWQSVRLDLGAKGVRQLGRIRGADDLLVQHEGSDAPYTPDHRPPRGLARQTILGLDQTREAIAQRFLVQRGGQADPVARLAAAQFAHRQPGLARQRIGRIQQGAASAGQQ